ncbi:hypothetical protein [Quadrisphaera sp. KR29]|uniref:hypothetical protein n=1 Tax=Quadrisphaera sp. KR29 TaxID=3461391 RepID=UPI004043E562
MSAEAAPATRAGRRAERRPARRRVPGWSVPLALLAVLLLGAGALLATALRPVEREVLDVPAAGGAALVVLTPELLASGGGPVEVRALGEGAVVLARGGADDVAAWAQGTTTATATGPGADGAVVLQRTEGTGPAPDPSGSDLWTAQVQGRGSAALDVAAPAATGEDAQAVLVASDGTAAAPAQVQLTYRHRAAPPAAWALLAAGGLAAGAVLRGRRRAAPGEGPDVQAAAPTEPTEPTVPTVPTVPTEPGTPTVPALSRRTGADA